jgi:hypothetical protein
MLSQLNIIRHNDFFGVLGIKLMETPTLTIDLKIKEGSPLNLDLPLHPNADHLVAERALRSYPPENGI